MRISQYFKLDRTQPTLDFVDVDLSEHVKAVIEPFAIQHLHSEWAEECARLVQDYFDALLECAKQEQESEAIAILQPLTEPDETHLGYSTGKSRHRALGPNLSLQLWTWLKQSRAVEAGLLADFQDAALLIEKVGPDLVSDIVTNVIRGPLIRYTQDMCVTLRIPMQPGLPSGPVWNTQLRRWETGEVELPLAYAKPLLFVPKAIVRPRLVYDVREYYESYLLPCLQVEALEAGSRLVRSIKSRDGVHDEKKVLKKDLASEFGRGKRVVVEQTLKHREVFEEYRKSKQHDLVPPFSHEDVAAVLKQPSPDWNALLLSVIPLLPGATDTADYERAIESLLTALFYPGLHYPRVNRLGENERRRIEITYANTGTNGFFQWLAQTYSATEILVDCRNNGTNTSDPDIDLFALRLAESRGHVGFFVGRAFRNKDRLIKKCQAIASEGRGYIVPLDDEDLKALTAEAEAAQKTGEFPLLRTAIEGLR